MREIALDIVAAVARLAIGLCILVTLLPLTRARAWWIRAWDFPRQQILAVGIMAALALLAATSAWGVADTLLLAALGLALAWQLAMVLPYTPLWRRQGQGTRSLPARSVRLVVANVLMTNRETDRLAGILAEADPDVVLALETDAWWVERLSAMLPAHPHRVLHPLDNTYGIALYSRLELLHPDLRFVLRDGIPSIRTRVRLRSGEDVVLIGIHPEPPSPTEADSSLPRDAELVLIGREIAGEAKPVIVAGDLNDVAWSRTSRLFRRLSGLIDPRIGRGFYNSFHAHYPLLRWPLDHVFYSPDFLLHGLQRLPAFGSDHFPILIDLEYHPRAAAMQEVDPAEHGDHREARDTLAEAAVVEERSA